MSKLEKGMSYPGLGIIAKLATVPEVAQAELLKVPGRANSAHAPIGGRRR
jgi:hypothetical protein